MERGRGRRTPAPIDEPQNRKARFNVAELDCIAAWFTLEPLQQGAARAPFSLD